MYQVDILHHRKCVLHFHGKYIKKSAADRQSDDRCSWWHCRVLFCKRYQYLVLLYTSNPKRGVNTNYHSPLPCPLLGSYAVSAELHGVTLKDRNLSTDHLWPTPAPTKSRCYVRIASVIVVLHSTNSNTVGNFKLFVCLITLPVHSVVALQFVLDFTTPLYLCLITLQAVIFRAICPLASNIRRVGDEVSDVMSVNTVLQQRNGKVVRLNIQFANTYSTTVVEFNTTVALVVLTERCNFVSAGTETIDSLYRQFIKGFRTYIT